MSHNWNDGTEQYNIEGKLRRANERISALESEVARLTAELNSKDIWKPLAEEAVKQRDALATRCRELEGALQACIDAGYWDTAGRNAHDAASAAISGARATPKEQG